MSCARCGYDGPEVEGYCGNCSSCGHCGCCACWKPGCEFCELIVDRPILPTDSIRELERIKSVEFHGYYNSFEEYDAEQEGLGADERAARDAHFERMEGYRRERDNAL